MEAKSEERAAYRVHLKLRRLHRKCFFWNMGEGNHGVAAYHFVCYVVEAVMSEYHHRRLAR